MKKILSLIFLLLPALCFAQNPIKVACIGNSVTFGYGHANPGETSYPQQLSKMLGDGYKVSNFGKSGATLLNKGHRPYTQQPEYKAALEFAPDIAVIHLGLNDTDPRNWPNYKDEFIPDYMSLIDTLQQINPAVKVYVCRMTPIFHWHRRFKSGTRDWYWQIQSAIEDIAQLSGAELIDLQETLYNRPDLMPDALHPNAEGAGLIAERVYGHLSGNFGGLQLPAIYSDNMVIQRGVPFRLSGRTNASQPVVAKLGKKTVKTTAGKDGKWQLEFPAMKADRKSYTLTIESNGKTLTYQNLVVGEVWLCSGQSNMAFMVKETSHAKESLSDLSQDIRLYDMKPRVYTDNVEWAVEDLQCINRHDYYLPTTWKKQNAKNVSDFSAVAYHFGKMLADSLGVPVGLICNAVGGATAESYIDRKTLEWHPQLVDILTDWRSNDMIQDWCRGRASKNIAKGNNPLQRHPYEPTYLYETGIAPITCYNIKGAIWYQGESNAHNIELHELIFPTLVEAWRNAWNNDKMPFYFVQLSSINRPSWPHFRDSQRRLAEAIPYCDYAVSSDKGHEWDVHPKQKDAIGQRLGLLALSQTYDFKHITAHGPEVEKATRKGKQVTLKFGEKTTLSTSDNQSLRTITVAGEIGPFYPADKVEIKGNKIIISCEKVAKPTRVRYGWQPYSTGNLVNQIGLPASTFEVEVE